MVTAIDAFSSHVDLLAWTRHEAAERNVAATGCARCQRPSEKEATGGWFNHEGNKPRRILVHGPERSNPPFVAGLLLPALMLS